MNKTLIALAVGAAFVAPAAYADVTLSGSINMGLAVVKSGDASSHTGNSITGATAGGGSITNTQVTTNYSNITIGSLEDLGGGLKLDFAFQMNPPLNNNGTITNRNSHIGLVGDSWGGVWYGTNEQLYEAYYYTVDPLDGAAGIGGNLQMLGTPGGSAFQNGNSGCSNGSGCAEFYRRQGEAIWFDSADYAGVTFGVGVGLNAYKTSATTDGPRFITAGVQYKPAGGPFFVNVGYEKHSDFFGLNQITGVGGATSSRDTGLQIGGGVTFGDFSILARYEELDYKSNGLAGATVNEYKRSAIWLGGKMTLPTGYVGLQVGIADSASCSKANGSGCNADNTGAKMVSAGYFHNLSKQSQLQFIGSYTNNDTLANYINIGSPNQAPGADSKSLAVLLKHVF